MSNKAVHEAYVRCLDAGGAKETPIENLEDYNAIKDMAQDHWNLIAGLLEVEGDKAEYLYRTAWFPALPRMFSAG